MVETGIHYFNTKRRTRKRGGFTPEELRNQTA
ncbi:IS3 family transposase [Lactiplantibacillus plantarum]